MRLRVIACEILAREIYHLASRADRIVDVSLLPKGLHGLGAEKMRERVQAEIDSTDASRYEGIALGYALCSRGTEGLVARDVPIAIPRAHDCITLLLGSRDRYTEEFAAHPGTYYYSAGWNERDAEDGGAPEGPAGPGLQSGPGGAGRERPGLDHGPGVMAELGLDREYAEYVERYGEENARYIVEQLRGGLRHYERVLFIEMGLGGEAEARAAAEERARREGWRFEVTKGDLGLLERMIASAPGAGGDVHGRGAAGRDLAGPDGDFVLLGPGESIAATNDDAIMECARCRSG